MLGSRLGVSGQQARTLGLSPGLRGWHCPWWGPGVWGHLLGCEQERPEPGWGVTQAPGSGPWADLGPSPGHDASVV